MTPCLPLFTLYNSVCILLLLVFVQSHVPSLLFVWNLLCSSEVPWSSQSCNSFTVYNFKCLSHGSCLSEHNIVLSSFLQRNVSMCSDPKSIFYIKCRWAFPFPFWLLLSICRDLLLGGSCNILHSIVKNSAKEYRCSFQIGILRLRKLKQLDQSHRWILLWLLD